MKIKQVTILTLWLISSVPLYADHYEPVAHCYQPSKPLWLASFDYKQRYKYEMEQYKVCIKAFIMEQKNAAQIHTSAAQNALQTWNNFIKTQ